MSADTNKVKQEERLSRLRRNQLVEAKIRFEEAKRQGPERLKRFRLETPYPFGMSYHEREEYIKKLQCMIDADPSAKGLFVKRGQRTYTQTFCITYEDCE